MMIRRAMRRDVRVRNAATVLAVLGIGTLLVGPPLRQLVKAARPAIGSRAATSVDSVRDVDAGRRALLARDSLTMLIFVDATCGECRINAQSYADLSAWAAVQGSATRVLIGNGARSGSQYARLAGLSTTQTLDAPEWFDRLQIRQTPSFVLVDQNGFVRARWLGQTPNHLAVLNALTKLDLNFR